MADEAGGRAPRSLAVVGSAYLIQGIIAGVGLAMLGRLAQLGTPLETQVGLLASGALPWLLKFVLAALLDLGPSWPMRVRGLLLAVLQIAIAVCLWGLAQAWSGGEGYAPGSLMALAIGWVTLNLCAALQDVLVDNLALDALPGRQAWTGALMGLGHAVGLGVLGSWLLGKRVVAEGMVAGLALPVWWVGALAVLPALLLWSGGRIERARSRAPQAHELGPRDRWLLLALPLVCVLANLGPSATGGAAAEFMFQELGWDYPSYSARLVPLAALAGVCGAFAWGPIVSRFGPARAAAIASAALGGAWLLFAAASPVWAQRGVVLTLAAFESLLQAALLVGLHAFALVVSARSPAPTTTFVLTMAAINLPRVLAPLAVPGLVELGYVALFVICGLVQLGAGAAIWALRGPNPANPRPDPLY